jgi:hypothetical protein
MAKPKHKALKQSFLIWQCEIRKVAMRKDGGRPSPGMCPRVLDGDGEQLASALTVLLVPKAPEEATAFFRFQVMKSADPRETYEKALRYLQADYFQEPRSFSDRLLATVPADAPLADALVAAKRCVLDFAQGRYAFRVPCKVKDLEEGDANREAAIWHNRIFNPGLSEDGIRVLAFKPDWETAETNF